MQTTESSKNVDLKLQYFDKFLRSLVFHNFFHAMLNVVLIKLIKELTALEVLYYNIEGDKVENLFL